MQIVKALDELRTARRALPGSFGLVPTMGYLHAGHLSLVEQARTENDHVGVSIFVNPTQFGPSEDLASYPRNLDQDLALLRNAGVDLVWTPQPEDVYPANFQTWVDVTDMTQHLEGAHRPGHFQGVTTVVAKLFNAFTPDRAYFGQKDAQQVAVIQRMVLDLNFPVDVIVCPTQREADGLALSSRNAYLTSPQREAAPVLFRALSAAQAAHEAGERRGDELRQVLRETLAGEPLALPQYVSAADPLTLDELDFVENGVLLSLAVFVGKTRLIDNFLLE
ncbi:MAG: pantoate--beta-alanine ligase [Caldilineaceae bacterium]|nr:pantoate--beta-alanine ligase [Caldilineaceae bacterium]MBP8109616.1 pantoate--beta-alanine ligase [Caldilineaceae bacterium]MBP8124494.1 pantoate--beta-alanine ligase [Caldilineaceae bacterium]MBP9074171.1 pantoate--beta-alanine ligase [Caldilineaceae bacterium]